MGRNKAIGPDQIPIEAWKILGDGGTFWLTSLFNKIFTSAKMPEDWRLSQVILIFKNKGDVQVCSNYRVEAIHLIRSLMEKYRERQRDLHMAFLDLEKAYDNVPRELIWKTLVDKGTSRRYVRVIIDMYDGGHPTVLIFADDILQVLESAEGLNIRLENLRKVLEYNGLRVSREKTEYLRGILDRCCANPGGLTKTVEVVELRMLRWNCGKILLDMIPNGVYRAQLEVESIINKMRQVLLRWFEHVRRRPQSAPVRRVKALVVEGLRRRGRPKLRWEDRVNHDMKELLLSEDMTSDRSACRARIRAPKKVLIREDAKSSVPKNVNYISLAKREKERNNKDDIATNIGINKTDTEMLVKEAEKENEVEDGTKNKPIKRIENDKVEEVPSSQPVGYYLKHKINEKLIEGFNDNNRFNDSLSGVQLEKMKGKTYNLSPRGPVYEAILKKKITKKGDIVGNFKIPCNIGGLKGINDLVDQGFDMNIMPYSTYMKLIDEMPAETDIRLSLASHSYIYPLGIAKDVLVDVAGHVYPVDFMILNIRENEKRPFILETPFLTMAKVIIKFDKGTITLRSGKSKISFDRIHESLCKIER
nr:hypothetical protein [Tanacetum cinerariifolium]